MPEMLNSKWTRLIWIDGFKYCPSAANEAKIEVVVVPIFEPSVIGYAVSKVTNPVDRGKDIKFNT